jgi:D-alanine-D-alanine ligase
LNGFRIGLLNKKRGNFAIQEKYLGADAVIDETEDEVAHHEQALRASGYDVSHIHWGPSFISDLQDSHVDIVFNVSSLVEATILDELGIPYVGSGPFAVAVATDKALAKKVWGHAGLPTAPFRVARNKQDCAPFRHSPPFDYPLFVKPVAGRGSAGIDKSSVVHDYDQLVVEVQKRYQSIEQPVLVEPFLQGREITWGIVGNGNNARVMPPLEIVYREGDVTLTYDKKELDDDTFQCPAPLAAEEAQTLRRTVLQAYQTAGFRDFGRIDTMLTEDGIMLLEGNTFAGLMCTPKEKPHSYIGFMARAEGSEGKDLLDEIVRAAFARLNMELPDRDVHA